MSNGNAAEYDSYKCRCNINIRVIIKAISPVADLCILIAISPEADVYTIEGGLSRFR